MKTDKLPPEISSDINNSFDILMGNIAAKMNQFHTFGIRHREGHTYDLTYNLNGKFKVRKTSYGNGTAIVYDGTDIEEAINFFEGK